MVPPFHRFGVFDGSELEPSAACAEFWGGVLGRGLLLAAMSVGLFCVLGGERVQAQITTTTTLGSSTASTTYGSIVLLTATVSSSSATGTVTFLNGTTTLGTGTLTSGVATLDSTGLPLGTNSVTAVYGGNGTYKSSTSNAVTVTVTAPATNVGTTSATMAVSFSFTSTVTLNATLGTAIQVLTTGIAGLDFQYVSGTLPGTCAAGATYTSGQTCTVYVSFTPLAPGVRLGAVELWNSAGAVVATTLVSGIGDGPLVGMVPGTISTVAGNGSNSTVTCTGQTDSAGDGCAATSAQLQFPTVVTADAAGNLYIADVSGSRIRKVTAATGIITTVAGNGSAATVTCSGYTDSAGDGCAATSAQLDGSVGVAVDGAGNLYIAEEVNERVRKVTAATGIITTVAGNGSSATVTCTGYTDSAGDGCAATSAQLDDPVGVAVDGAGNLYIADGFNYRIRKVTAATGIITTVAGNGSNATVTCSGYTDSAGDGCAATSAQINFPAGVAVDGAGNLYIADENNFRIRKVTAGTGIITTVAGNGSSATVTCSGYTDSAGDGCVATSAEVTHPAGVVVDSAGNLYIADEGNNRVRKVTAGTGIISTMAGNGSTGTVTCTGYTDSAGDGCAATSGEIYNPYGVAVDGTGNLYIADSEDYRIRKVTATANPLTFASMGAGASSAAQTVTLANNGNATLTATALATSNSNFTLSGSTCTATGTVASGNTCTIGVEFTPQSVGSLTGTASYTDNALNVAGTVQSIALSGTATIGTQTITFPQPTTPATTNTSATLMATASSGLPVTYQITVGNAATLSGTNDSTITYTGVGSVLITAFQLGNSNYSMASQVSRTVTIFDATTFTAPTTNVGTTSATQTVTMTIATAGTTASTQAAGIKVLTQGAAGLDFAYVSGGTCAVSTAYTAGQTCTVDINFTPTHPWVRYGGITLESSAGTVLAQSFVTGTGTGPQVIFPEGTAEASSTLGGGFSDQGGVAVDGNGNVYVADTYDSEVKKIPAGCTSSSCVTVLGGGFSYLQDVAVDGSGNVYVADYDTASVKVMAASCTSSSCVKTLGGGFSAPAGVAVDGSGNVYVADSGSNLVQEMAPGCASSSCVSTLGGGFSSPYGVAVDSSGNIYVADYGNSKVKEMAAGCASSSCVTTLGGASTFSSPMGVAVDGSGNVYVADTSNNLVREMTANCTTSSCVTTLGSGFDNPEGVAVDASGDVYGSDSYHSAVREMLLASPPALTYVSTAVGATSAAQSVPVSNDGNAALTLSSFAATINFSAAAGSCGASLAAGSTCDASFSFAPTVTGALTGTGTVTDNMLNVSGSTQTFALSGTATAATGTTAQTITFTQPTTPVANGVSPITLSASSTSGLTVSFTVTSGPGTVSGSTLTITGSGTVVVTAYQNGNSTYSAAATVSRSIVVTSSVATVSAVASTYSSTTGITVTATESGSYGAVTGGVVTFSVISPATGSFSPTTCTLSSGGTCTTTYTPTGSLAVGTYANDISASFGAVGNYGVTTATSTLSITEINLNEVVLLSFSGNSGANPGASPNNGTMIQGSDGNFYGTTLSTGANGYGTVYKMTPAGAMTVLHSFASGTADGGAPYGGLVEGIDGNFYGVTYEGGANGDGIFYQITSAGGFTLLHSFAGGTSDGAVPYGDLVQATDGSFYGTTSSGGSSGNYGTVYKITTGGSVTLLHVFTGGTGDGSAPQAGLVQGTDGYFYGTTTAGGTSSDGTIFRVGSSGGSTYSLLHSFAGGASDGSLPYGALVEGTDGLFYGVTNNGGASSGYGYGTVYKVTTGGAVTLLHIFTSTGQDGEYPQTALVLGSDGNFYGTTNEGGAYGDGSAFSVTSGGSLRIQTSFPYSSGYGTYYPSIGLVQGQTGYFYGATQGGGSNRYYGALFALEPYTTLAAPVQLSTTSANVLPGATFTLTYSVTNATSDSLQYCFATNNAGDTTGWTGLKTGSTTAATASLTASSVTGAYTYSLTCGGQESSVLTVYVAEPYSVTPTTTVSSVSTAYGSTTGITVTATESGTEGAVTGGVVTFGVTSPATGSFSPTTCTLSSSGTCTTSYVPTGTLATGSYSNDITASFAEVGNYAAATTSSNLFVSESATLSLPISFTGTTGANPGSFPQYTNLIQASDGNFYGVTNQGGTNNYGTVFKLTPGGTLSVLHNFSSATTDGKGPYGGLVEGSDGNLYGTTSEGGANSDGTVYKITTGGTFSLLHSFAGGTGDGNVPNSGLIQGIDGNFYGTTEIGGAGTYGTAYQITTGGTVTLLHSFTGGTSDGLDPTDGSGLVQGTDGYFYGMTLEGGTYSEGTAYRVGPTGGATYSLLHSFGSADGESPWGGLVVGSDGYLYGTTQEGGANSYYGAVFKMNTSGSVTLLHSFAGADGDEPEAGLVLGSDGNFYGTTEYTSTEYGEVFAMSPAGSVNVLHVFTGSPDGQWPNASVMQGQDGNFYGTTQEGGIDGAIFKVTVTPTLMGPVQVSLSSSTVATGEAFTLTYTVTNAYSDTLQRCFATNTTTDRTDWSGLITGSATAAVANLTASGTAGTYTYALTCGGMESATVTLTVTAPIAQTITFTQPVTPTPVNSVATLVATGGGSGNPVTFAITGGTGTATLSGTNNATITYTGTGTVMITASQAAAANYSAATSVTKTVQVTSTSAITWSPAVTTIYSGAAIGASVLNANSTTAGTFAYTATISSGSPVAVTSTSTLTEGNYTLTANFTPSNTSANAPATMTQSLTVQNMNAFVVNSGGTVSSDYNNGANASAATTGGGIGAAVDPNGYVWSINTSGSSVSKFTDAGALSVSYSGGSISGATALAIDGKGVVWIANGGGTISALTNAGAADVSPPIASAGNLSTPSSISVDAAGSLWVANSGNGTVTEVIGVAAPVVAPAVTAVTNSTEGTRP